MESYLVSKLKKILEATVQLSTKTQIREKTITLLETSFKRFGLYFLENIDDNYEDGLNE